MKGRALIIGNWHHRYLEALFFHMLDFQHIRVGKDGIVDFQYLAVLSLFLQKISLLPHIHRGAGDNFLPDGVNGRIGYLGKELLEIVKQGALFLGKHCQGSVHAHGGDPLTAV